MDTFSLPPLARDQNPLHPLTDNTDEMSKAAAEWTNLASAQNTHVANFGNELLGDASGNTCGIIGQSGIADESEDAPAHGTPS